MTLSLKTLYQSFREPLIIQKYRDSLELEALKLESSINIMEVCGGHTHTIMKYGIDQLIPKNIDFIHGPGCPVCVIPKERVDDAYTLAMQKDVILLTLADMIKVVGSKGTLQDARANGADVRFLYTPLDALKIAKDNINKKIIFFAIGFETTTPMTAVLVERVIKDKISNLLFYINHIRVVEPIESLLNSSNSIDAIIAPSHVSVISGSNIYNKISRYYKKPIVVGGFEPVDMMESILMILKQINQNIISLDIQYRRSVTPNGNLIAKELINRYFEQKDSFRWRGLGYIPKSSLKLRDEYSYLDAEIEYSKILSTNIIDDAKLCICGNILRGEAKPQECRLFAKNCTPTNPIGSCMVSNEGVCAAYYRYRLE